MGCRPQPKAGIEGLSNAIRPLPAPPVALFLSIALSCDCRADRLYLAFVFRWQQNLVTVRHTATERARSGSPSGKVRYTIRHPAPHISTSIGYLRMGNLIALSPYHLSQWQDRIIDQWTIFERPPIRFRHGCIVFHHAGFILQQLQLARAACYMQAHIFASRLVLYLELPQSGFPVGAGAVVSRTHGFEWAWAAKGAISCIRICAAECARLVLGLVLCHS